MFETDEWEIDEDYLKDFNADEVIKEFDNEGKNETDKLGSVSKTKSTNTSRFEFNCSTSENAPKKEKDKFVDTVSRKNAILDIFKNADNLNASTSSNSLVMHNTSQPTIPAMNTVNIFRKNLVLDVFQENKCSVPKRNCTKVADLKSVLRIPEETLEINNENKLKRKKNVAFSESVNGNNSAKKKCASTLNVLSNTTRESSSIQNLLPSRTIETTLNSKNHLNDTRKEIMVGLLKSPVQKISKITRISAPHAVTRQFPGPAGLLPDDVNESEIIDLESVDVNKNNRTNKYTDICSQNTKNLFTTGAWQLMTDDLPAEFELYDIASVKENAVEYSKAYKKIPYLAGIIQYIDYKPNDPQVVLKDLTGKIDARIHHSICKLYPNALGTQIVILVKDVGLIVTSKKYVCLIISLKNLVSLYSDDARLVETPHLEKLLDNNFNCNLNQSQISVLDEDYEHTKKQNTEMLENKQLLSKDNSSTAKNKESMLIKLCIEKSNDKQQTKDVNQLDGLQDFDFDENDSWLGVNFDDLNSFKCNQFPSSTPMDTNERNDLVNESTSAAKISDDFTRSRILCEASDERKEFCLPAKKNNDAPNISKNLIPATHFEKDTKLFGDDSDDSDDEVLSQLDVDAIAASYNG
ncbi:uncharacterized protein LOC107981445 [Nasonia vitripennis]|uniref:Homologous recombination OB-fold protein OB-fold domain-containing protein n=1 Tax=Nasonia vitripennis TaxID=7425 RepID=A0A7M7QJW9_NASVI|nr:uncharacterized protein LOC107981445 [Nasonia vitripennis]XP_031788892.1 uncharacterized protein LOC107981445 [Nasonia vitripennis]XP_031788893.1 uncharacterized protein LOC107981445 [Nasonia vitripennis]